MTLTAPTPASYWQHYRALRESLAFGLVDPHAKEQLLHIVNYGETVALRKAAWNAVKETRERREPEDVA